MNSRDAIKLNIDCANMICQSYLADLTDADLLVRSVPGMNHIAWQLGHLIVGEHEMTEAAFPGSMPALPAGFAEKYTKDTSRLDSASAFHTKDVYLKLAAEQRAATLAKLESLTDADLDKAVEGVCQKMKASQEKSRVTFYYLLADHFGKLDLFTK